MFPFLPLIAWHHPALHLTFAFAVNYRIWGKKIVLYLTGRITLAASSKPKSKLYICISRFSSLHQKAAAKNPIPSMVQRKLCILLQERDGKWKSVVVPQPHFQPCPEHSGAAPSKAVQRGFCEWSMGVLWQWDGQRLSPPTSSCLLLSPAPHFKGFQ